LNESFDDTQPSKEEGKQLLEKEDSKRLIISVRLGHGQVKKERKYGGEV
jgi:hypothetical protein